jgi:hypothetical protein
VGADHCKHENADHLMPDDVWHGEVRQIATVEHFRCCDCGGFLSLGPSNDDSYGVWIEMHLAEMLADRDFKHDSRITRDDLDEATIELMSEQVPKARRPRSPIEILVDRACGVPS